jgi:hypothetical protein
MSLECTRLPGIPGDPVADQAKGSNEDIVVTIGG